MYLELELVHQHRIGICGKREVQRIANCISVQELVRQNEELELGNATRWICCASMTN